MSVLCDALVALGLAFGGLCAAPEETAVPTLPEDEKTVWVALPPTPEPEPVPPPVFPPVIIKQAVPVPPPPEPVTLPPEPVAEPVAPPPPSPLRLALETVLSGPARGGGIDGTPGEPVAAPVVPAPAGFTPPAEAPAAGLRSTQERYEAPEVISGLPVDNTRILAADRYIPGIMETGLNSQLDSGAGGQAIIQVSRNVFGYHGRSVLVPKGSRLICDYRSPSRQGDTRIAFTCTRILLGGHRAEILQLGAAAGDVQGRGGVAGDVDNRFWERYGTAFLLTGISTSVRFATAVASTRSQNKAAQNNTQTSALAEAADTGAEELSQKFGEISASVLEQTVNLTPIITIAQGTRVQIRPAKDWYIRETGES